MPRLLLIRHAKAADGHPDRDRPLAPSGVAAASAIGRWLGDQQIAPDRVVVSPARRTVQTWRHAAAAGVAPVTDERIYGNTLDDLLAVIRGTPDEVSTLALVGHNPAIHALAAELDDTDDQFDGGFPTGGVAVFEVPVGWSAVGAGSARLATFARPG
ncbi:MAG: histidine phosphatase family protein [Actinomycetota bacterium]